MTDCFSHGSRVLKVFQIKKLSWQAQGSISHLEIKECIMSPTRFTYRFYTLSEFELEESRSVEKRVLIGRTACVTVKASKLKTTFFYTARVRE